MSEPLFEAPEAGPPRISGGMEPAAQDPVASVLLESSVPHLARAFDYGIPASLSDEVRPGVRVRVRFAGALTTGYVVGRGAESDYLGELAPIRRVVSPIEVLPSASLALCTAVAERYAGTVSDVVRLAVPPRHGQAEKRFLERDLEAEVATARELVAAAEVPDTRPEPVPASWDAFASALGEWLDAEDPGPGPRAVMTTVPADQPGSGWMGSALAAAMPVLRAGRTVLLLVPDHRDLLEAERALGPLAGAWVRLSADQGPQARCTAFLAGLHGTARLVIGTRAAVFQPMPDLGLIVLVDDAHAAFQEQRSPAPHTREVSLLRTAQSGAALLLLGPSRSPEAQRLVDSGWAGDIRLDREVLRRAVPRVQPVHDEHHSRMPEPVFRALRSALGRQPDRSREAAAQGPVLISVPRGGYLPGLSCARCRARVLCPVCERPVAQRSPRSPMVCPADHELRSFRCPECGGTRARSAIIGIDRTHEELGRAFPGIRVLRSWGEHILHRIEPGPAILVATQGAEPLVDGGYAAGIILDADHVLARPGLRSIEQTLAAWFRVGGLIRSSAHGGRLVIVGENPLLSTVLTRWDTEGFARAELEDRAELLLPPAGRQAVLTGRTQDLRQVIAELEPGPEVMVRGPIGDPPELTLRFPHRSAGEVTRRLAQLTAARSARKAGEPVLIRVDGPG